MPIGLSILLTSLVYSIFLNFLYYTKLHIKNHETKIFGMMIVTNIIGIFLEIFCYISVAYMNTLMSIIASKIFLIYIISFIFLFLLYVLLISINETDVEKFEQKYNNIKKVLIIVYAIFVVIAMLLKLEVFNNELYAYSYGPATIIVYGAYAICSIVCIISLINNYKNLKNKKYLPIFIYMFLGGIVAVIQFIYPWLTLITSMETFLTFVMYFTIENPDVKMIEQLRISEEKAVKATNAKSDFLSSMSHELRTPLNAIIGFSNGILEDDDINSETRDDVKNIVVASDSMLELVNGILDISKIEANKLDVINVEYSFRKAFDELVLLAKARLGDKPLDFRYHYDESLPEWLYGDVGKVKQVIINLLTNAIKYTKEGYIDFRINSVIVNNVVRIIVSVEDSGIGIKQENISKLFTKFDRLGVEKDTDVEGTGLGLAVTKKLVELMNGKIVVQSVYGKGSRFTFSVDQLIVTGEKLAEIEKRQKEEEKKVFKDYSNKTILIVDDNTLNIKVVERLLKVYKVNIDSALSGREAIEKIKSGKQYNLIFMDDMMPEMNGLETLNNLKAIPGFNIPVASVTGNATEGTREKYLKDGFNDYLSKPLDKNELDRIIKTYLNR